MANRASVIGARVDLVRDPADVPQFDPSDPITKLHYLVWSTRPDLRAAFDISQPDGQAAFKNWAKEGISREYGLDWRTSDNSLAEESESYGGALAKLKAFLGGGKPIELGSGKPGATLIGYAGGVLGMGEHVRMSAEALCRAGTPFGILDIGGAANRQAAQVSGFPTINGPCFKANIFHVNADQMLPTFCRLGPAFFQDYYNIGFWAWELARWPTPWHPVLELVDEIWAPSRFIQNCLSDATRKPVVHMPLCVELPPFERLPRTRFGLPEDSCLFLFTFDFHSYIERKNPLGAIRAFKRAFPSRDAKAGLVIKAMNADANSAAWRDLIQLIDADPRIFVINEVMSRTEVLALTDACDCFVSLHRSEGFGRGPAEAMYLGKPVIVTGYSGNTDFTRAGASFLVGYHLVPVAPGAYVHGEGQVWADPDIDEAATHMRKVQENSPEVASAAAHGQAIIKREFSNVAVGRNMVARLGEVGLLKN